MSLIIMQCVVYRWLLSGVEIFVSALNASRILGWSEFSLQSSCPLKNCYSHCVLSVPLMSMFSNAFCVLPPSLSSTGSYLLQIFFLLLSRPFNLLFFANLPLNCVLSVLVDRACPHLGVGLTQLPNRLCLRNSRTLNNLTSNLYFLKYKPRWEVI